MPSTASSFIRPARYHTTAVTIVSNAAAFFFSRTQPNSEIQSPRCVPDISKYGNFVFGISVFRNLYHFVVLARKVTASETRGKKNRFRFLSGGVPESADIISLV